MAKNKIHLDFETRSACDLKKCGAARYAMDPTTEIILARYKIGDGPMRRWTKGDPVPWDLVEAVADGTIFCAHNALFEFYIWTYICEPRLGWGKLSPFQMDCTMARAHIMSLQGSLDMATALLGLHHRKDKVGYALMLKMCKPRKPRKGEDPHGLYWHEEPEDIERLGEYCESDVLAEIGLDENLPEMSDQERETYHYDIVINSRGFALDTELMRRADKFLECAKGHVDDETFRLTEGTVAKSTQVEALKTWLRSRGLEVTSIGKGEQEAILADADSKGDDLARRVIELRQLGAKATSLAKYGAGLRCVGYDGRARGLLQYHKASTGRWAGSLYQPHNLERIDPDSDMHLVETMLTILEKAQTPADAVAWAEMLGYEPLRAIGKCTRAMIVARDGHELIGADYSNVEGRGSAWLAGEDWKIEAFKAYDEGTGPDLYKLAYSKSFGEPVENIGKGPKRQIGKVQELSLGYQGSVGAFLGMGANYGMKPDMLLSAVKPVADRAIWDNLAAQFAVANSYGLTQDQWTAFKYVVQGWRDGHPKTVNSWWAVQDAVVEAVSNPGEMVQLFGGKVRFYCARNRRFLHIFLPSGRPLSYFRPRLKPTKRTLTGRDGESYVKEGVQVIVEGWDSRKNVWGDVALYGGIIWENIIQALCRDLLRDGILRLERAGYPVVLHVHDEAVVEVPVGLGDEEEVKEIMGILSPWAGGFPLVSAAWRDKRYVK